MFHKLLPKPFEARFLHFPIHHKFHWTLLVLDKEEGAWKFYNSLKGRKGGRDPHYNTAVEVVRKLTF